MNKDIKGIKSDIKKGIMYTPDEKKPTSVPLVKTTSISYEPPKSPFERQGDVLIFKGQRDESNIMNPFQWWRQGKMEESLIRGGEVLRELKGNLTMKKPEAKPFEPPKPREFDLGKMLEVETIKYEGNIRKFIFDLPEWKPPEFSPRMQITREALKNAYETASRILNERIKK